MASTTPDAAASMSRRLGQTRCESEASPAAQRKFPGRRGWETVLNTPRAPAPTQHRPSRDCGGPQDRGPAGSCARISSGRARSLFATNFDLPYRYRYFLHVWPSHGESSPMSLCSSTPKVVFNHTNRDAATCCTPGLRVEPNEANIHCLRRAGRSDPKPGVLRQQDQTAAQPPRRPTSEPGPAYYRSDTDDVRGRHRGIRREAHRRGEKQYKHPPLPQATLCPSAVQEAWTPLDLNHRRVF